MTNPVARALRDRARADRDAAASLAVQMATVRRTIDAEFDRWWSLRRERLALLARAEDAEQDARDVERDERMARRSA